MKILRSLLVAASLSATFIAVSAPTDARAAWDKLPALVPVQMGLSCEYMQFFSDNVGWVRASDGFFATTDGMTFTRLRPVPIMNMDVFIAKPAPLTAQDWITIGARLAGMPAKAVMKTTDQGATWVEKPFTPLGPGALTGQVRTFGPSNALFYGYRQDGANYTPFLAKTIDGGETTTDLTLPFPAVAGVNQIVAAAMADAMTIVFTQSGGGGNSVQRSTDGGQTWTPVMQGTANTVGFLLIQFTDATHGFAWGTQGVRSSTDGGATWSDPVPVALKISPIPAMAFNDAMNGLIGGQDATSNAAALFRTSDGGLTWAPETLPADWAGTAESVNCLSFPGPSAYAGPRAGGEKVWLKNATAGGTPDPSGTGGAGAGGATGTGGTTGAAGAGGAGGAAGAAGTTGAAGMPGKSGGGGGCAIGGGASAGLAAAAFVLGLALLTRRRRRSQI